MKKRLSWLPAILVMIIIFNLSSKPADISGQSSLKIADNIYSIYEGLTGQVKEGEERLNILRVLDHVVRKGAHITEYAILAAAIAWPLYLRGISGARLAYMTIGMTAFYAITDEYHQTFVPGRSGEIRDVLIDTIGAVIGFSLFKIIKSIQHKRERDQINKLSCG